MKRWLDRFSMSFLIVAVVLVWEGYKSPGTPKAYFFPFLAAVCFVLFFFGTRERHRRIREMDDSNEK